MTKTAEKIELALANIRKNVQINREISFAHILQLENDALYFYALEAKISRKAPLSK